VGMIELVRLAGRSERMISGVNGSEKKHIRDEGVKEGREKERERI